MPGRMDARYWRARADAARKSAKTFTDAVAKRAMLEIAKSYELIAERAERQSGREKEEP